MAVSDPSNTYKWLIPDVGGDIGSWGGLLNDIMARELEGDDLTDWQALKTSVSPPAGIDQVIHLLQVDLTAAEVAMGAVATRVTTLENAPPALLTAALGLTSPFNVSAGSGQPIGWQSVKHDAGGLTDADSQKVTVPVNGLGLWQLRAAVKMESHSGGSGNDDARYIELAIVKNGLVLGMGLIPNTTNGSHSSLSQDVSCEASVIDVAADGDVYEVWITTGQKNGQLTADLGTYFEAIRISKEVP